MDAAEPEIHIFKECHYRSYVPQRYFLSRPGRVVEEDQSSVGCSDHGEEREVGRLVKVREEEP